MNTDTNILDKVSWIQTHLSHRDRSLLAHWIHPKDSIYSLLLKLLAFPELKDGSTYGNQYTDRMKYENHTTMYDLCRFMRNI